MDNDITADIWLLVMLFSLIEITVKHHTFLLVVRSELVESLLYFSTFKINTMYCKYM